MKLNRKFFKSKGYYVKEILGFLFILFAIYFFRHETHELHSLGKTLRSANETFLFLGAIITLIYCLFHALMYVYSFKSIGENIGWQDGLKLFLKRNFVSVFLPGGGVTSLAFFSTELERKGTSKTKISLASYIYGLIGLFTVFLVTIPAIIFLLFTHKQIKGDLTAFIGLALIIISLVWASISLLKKGWVFKKIIKYRPDTELILEEIATSNFSLSALIKNILVSVCIELLGILHLIVAMRALGISGFLDAAFIGYVIATLFLVISPFLKGLGAVELSLILVLKGYGMGIAEATAVTFLYRLFEFWLPLAFGLLSFVWGKGSLVLRVLPAILLFGLGLIDIVSVLTPGIHSRLDLLTEFLPIEALRLSGGLVLLIGVLQLVTSAFLLKGMRNAWIISLTLCLFSIAGNLFKGLDYEEASFAFIVMIILIMTRKDYYVRSNKNVQRYSLHVVLYIFLAISVYGIIGFYFLDVRHFGVSFSINNAILSTYDNFILLNSGGLVPQTHFGRFFLYSIRILGASSILLIFYGIIRPFIFKDETQEHELKLAKDLVEKYGCTSVDYFKTYEDKLLFFASDNNGFIAYRTSRDYAIVLEGPVCEKEIEVKIKLIKEFEDFCFQNGLKSAYYRVDEEGLEIFNALGKKNIIIGQEAIVSISSFSLEGGNRKSLRNAVNGVVKKGFMLKTYTPEIKSGTLQKLRQVSDNWLNCLDREEIVFSGGLFDEEELSGQIIITLEDTEERIVAFLNIIPDFASGELTYDLIRKSEDAPGGNMDALIVQLINYGKENGFNKLNMGMAPMSGIEKGRDLPERTIKFAYEKMKMFRHYHGLRDFKDKFSPTWEDRFLVYENHYDLLRLPAALNTVIKP